MRKQLAASGLAVALVFGFSLSGCGQEEGPAERMGRALDEGVEQVGESAREAAEGAADVAAGAARTAEEAAEAARKKAEETVEDYE